MKIFGTKRSERLNRRFSDLGIEYSYNGEYKPEFPLNSNNPNILAKLLHQGELWSALDSMWAEGLLEPIGDNSWRLSYAVYETLDENEEDHVFEVLQIPKPQPLSVEAKSFSHVAKEDFSIFVEATHPDHGPLRENDPVRFGRVFLKSEKIIVPLTKEQANLFDAAKGEGTDWTSLEDRMCYLSATKASALKAGARIDNYLKNEEYEFRTEAKIDLVEHSPEEVQIIPGIEGIEDYGVHGSEILCEKIRGVFTKATSTPRRKRMVLSGPLKERLAKLPNNGRITGAQVPKLLTQPESIIPEGFDLSLFSERVKGIRTRVYNSRPYIHVGRNRGGWFEGIPGVSLEDWSPVGDQESFDKENDSPASKTPNLSNETYRKLAERAKETGEEYVLHEGNWIRIDSEGADRFGKTLSGLESEGDIHRIPAGSILEIFENLDLLEFVDKQTLELENDQLPSDLPIIPQPDTFQGKLYPHQLDGYRWLNRISNNLVGGLLADDMGLGKTIQVIAHFLKLKELNIPGPHLIVIPKTLMENWQREISLFSGGKLSVYPYDGFQRIFNVTLLENFDVVLTTYDTLKRDQSMLGTMNWNMVVCDEAQYAKNPTTQRTCAVKALKSKHRAALTGTPVENGLIEFWCIMDFVQPGLLGSWADFRRDFERPIVESKEEDREKKVGELLSKMKGHYLRRLKDQTINLPQKNIEIRETRLSDVQLKIYRSIAREAQAGGKGAKLAAVQKLLMLCAHPSTSTKIDIIEGEGNENDCPKMSTTMTILDDIRRRNEKAIVFSDFKIVQRALQRSIREKFGIWPDIINGEITSHRQRIIDIFSEKFGFNVIVLGHQVAGIGLNITAANHVIHYTRPWNPAKENQATDRAHRIGQKKSVTVYYPMVKDEGFKTVEERLAELIQSKEKLARDVLRPSKEMEVKAEELFECINSVT